MTVYIDGNFIGVAFMLVFAVLFTAMFMWFREPHIHAAGFNKGYEEGVEQGIAEEREHHGGPPAPIRIEELVR